MRDKDGRDDAYQEVLVHIWKNLGSFEGRSQIGTWIYRITVNTCLRHLEKEQRRHALFTGDLRKGLEIADSPGEGDAGENEKAVERLYDCINQLPTMDKVLISLSLEDLSTKDIADVLDISEVNARVKLHRVRKNLRHMLERNGHGSR